MKRDLSASAADYDLSYALNAESGNRVEPDRLTAQLSAAPIIVPPMKQNGMKRGVGAVKENRLLADVMMQKGGCAREGTNNTGSLPERHLMKSHESNFIA